MRWILGGIYCGILWLVFAKLKLIRLSLPIAILAASVGPLLIIALLFCAQYFHPFTADAHIFEEVIPIVPQLRQAGRVIDVPVQANVRIAKGDLLFRVDPVPYQNSVDLLNAALDEAKQNLLVSEASIKLSEATLERATANLNFAIRDRDRGAELIERNAMSQAEFDMVLNRFAEANAAESQATTSLTQARLSVELAKAKITQSETQLSNAIYDLEQTSVYAPHDGFVTNLQLREGMMVGGAGTSSVMSFISERSEVNRGIVVAAFDQKNYLRIKEGNYAEVALFGYPGEIFTGRVQNVIDVSGAGQLTATGILPTALGSGQATRFAVRIKLDKGDDLRLPGGSRALAAVYTEDVQISGIPIMFLIRAQSWMRYVM